MENTKQFFDGWFQSQSRILEGFMDMTRKYQESFRLPGATGGGMPAFGGSPNVYTSWISAIQKALLGTGAGDRDLVRETLSKTLSSSNAYQMLYEMWNPLFKAIQDKTFNPNTYTDMIDPKKYKEALDRVFGFDPEIVSQGALQASKLLEALTGSAQEFMKPWVEASMKNVKTFPLLMEGRPDAFMQAYHSLFNAFDTTFGRIFHVPPVGKDREKVELLLRSIDDLSVYFAKYTEYQHTMYLTGMVALEKVNASVIEKASKGEDLKCFDDVFDLWIHVSEGTYFELFQSEAFSKLQGELLGAGLNVRGHNFKLMELYLYDYPIALRSEMDDLYKTVYELKKKVKSLERQFGEVAA
jgi:class III poly(R)-hydroxyalkanoic acid synthase PhaE subunit